METLASKTKDSSPAEREEKVEDYLAPQEMSSLIGELVPLLLNGAAGAAFHGLIHTGFGVDYALEGGSPDILLQGLAYMAHSYTPILRPLASEAKSDAESQFQWPKDNRGRLQLLRGLPEAVIEGLSDVREDVRLPALIDEWKESVDFSPSSIGYVGFQQKHLILMQKGQRLLRAHVNAILEGANTIGNKLPEPKDSVEVDAHAAATALFVGAIHVFNRSTSGDFFLLHLVTGSWALQRIVSAGSNHLPATLTPSMVQIILQGAVGTYVAQDCPLLFPSEAKALSAIFQQSSVAAGVADKSSSDGDQIFDYFKHAKASAAREKLWQALADEANRLCSQGADEHIVKVVFVAHRMRRLASPLISDPIEWELCCLAAACRTCSDFN